MTSIPAPSRKPAVPQVPLGHLQAGWQFLTLRYHTKAERNPNAEALLWRNEIDNPPDGQGGALPTYSVSFPDGPRTIIVSVAQLGAAVCDNGPNSAASTRDYAVCPAKVGVVEGGRLVMSRAVGKLCAETINDGGVREGAPDWKDPTLWGTRALYDGRAHTIELSTLQNGQVEMSCSRTIRVPT